MQLISLDQVFQLLKPGLPLPWGVRDAEGQLLLAKGHVVADETQLMGLLNRGMFVDAEDIKRSREPRKEPPTERFSSLWTALQGKLGNLLRAPGDPDFLKHLIEVQQQIANFPERKGDQIIFLIVRHDHSQRDHYGEAHSLQVAALCHLASRRLGWPEDRRQSLIGAALSMNLAVINLQAQLAAQRGTLSAVQRQDMDAHPLASAALLRAAGLQDPEWLRAVEQHHECPDGSGYPLHLKALDDMSQLLRLADRFVAKHSARAGRGPQPAPLAAGSLYSQSGASPLAAALIKELGIYPPGCYVKLISGEIAIVTRRGDKAKEPWVAALSNRNGEPLSQAVSRDTSLSTRTITGTADEKLVKLRVTADQLYEAGP